MTSMARTLALLASCFASSPPACAIGVATANSSLRPQAASLVHLRPDSAWDTVPLIRHQKEPGDGYSPGSPLFNKQVAFDRIRGSDDSTSEKKGGRKKAEKENKEGTALGGGVRDPMHGDHPGALMAIGMFSTVCFLSMVISLASSPNKVVSSHSWFCIDQVILIFIAVMNYQAFDCLSHHFIQHSHHKMIAAALQAILLFMFAFFISWKVKGEKVSLAILCGAGAHFVSFASMNMCEVTSDHFAGEHALWRKLVVFVCFLGIFFCFSTGIYFMKKKMRLDDDAWNDKITDTENDFISMALALVWTMFVFHLVIGQDLELEVAPEDALKLTMAQELILVAYAIFMVPVSMGLHKVLAGLNSTSMLVSRLAMFAAAFSSMASCWAFLFLAQMHFYSHWCMDRPLFCRVVFAMLTQVVVAFGIIGLAALSTSRSGGELTREVTVALTAFSLASGWSWEQCFDAAMDSVTDEMGYSAVWLKPTLSFLLVLVVLPTYVNYIKPIVVQKTACLGG